NQKCPLLTLRVLRQSACARVNDVRSSLYPCRSTSAVNRESKPPNEKGRAATTPPLPNDPACALTARDVSTAVLWTTWMTPTKDVAPYVTGAGPRSTSMRATSVRLRVASAGLNAP